MPKLKKLTLSFLQTCGFFHAYIGQEAIAAGCMTATQHDDPFITAYRDHGLALAKGVSADACMAELYGKATGCAKGKGGSMHFFSLEHRFFGGHGIVGAQIGTAGGLAFAEKYKGTDNVVLCYFGDGAAVPLNFNLEYSTRNENWRLKMFSRSNNLLLQQSGSITNGVSGNTLGGGALYRREFETFRRKKTPITTTTEEKPVE